MEDDAGIKVVKLITDLSNAIDKISKSVKTNFGEETFSYPEKFVYEFAASAKRVSEFTKKHLPEITLAIVGVIFAQAVRNLQNALPVKLVIPPIKKQGVHKAEKLKRVRKTDTHNVVDIEFGKTKKKRKGK